MEERKNDVICIIGMPRSGKSLVVRLLNLCGLDLGPPEHIMEPNESNPLGYFENLNFTYKIDDALLNHFGGSWDNPPILKEGWENDSSIEQIVLEAKSLIKTFTNNSKWGWKDPRASLLIPFWKSLIPDLQFIICVRSPLEVAKSLAKRDEIPTQKALYLWNYYMRAAIRDTEGCPRIFNFFEDFFKEDSSSEIKRLVDFCGLQMSEDLSSLHDTIPQEVKHHKSESYELLNEDKLIAEYKLFYIGLRALTTEGFADSTSYLTREQLVSENISKFLKLLEEFHSEQRLLQLSSELEELKADHETLTVKAEVLETDRNNLRVHAENLKKDRDALRIHAENLEKERDNLRAHAENLEKERDNLRAHAENLEKDRDNLRVHAENLEIDRDQWIKHVESIKASKLFKLNEKLIKIKNIFKK